MEMQCWPKELPGKVQFGDTTDQVRMVNDSSINPLKKEIKCDSADCTLSVRWEAREGQASIGTQPERGLKIHLVKKERGLKIYLVKNESGIKIHLVKKEGG